MKKFLLLLFVLALVGGAGTYYYYNLELQKPLEKKISLEVEKGQTFNSALKELAGKTNFKALFGKIYIKAKGLDSALKPGKYEFEESESYADVIQSLVEGQVIEYKVTVPEGFNLFELAELLYLKKIISNKEKFTKLALTGCSMFLKSEMCPHKSVEGYLFPETYQFSENTPALKVIERMVQLHMRHKKNILNKFSYPNNLKTWPKVVTMASVIEKETGAPWERPKISSVFHNRLNRNMRLQSDPTIIYGRWIQDGKRLFNIQKKHLNEKNNYNTYAKSSLPVGPISNPGRKSLEAAMNPESTDFLYFVSQNDGTHKFSRSYKEHQRAVREFQMRQSARKNKSWRDLKSREEKK